MFQLYMCRFWARTQVLNMSDWPFASCVALTKGVLCACVDGEGRGMEKHAGKAAQEVMGIVDHINNNVAS